MRFLLSKHDSTVSQHFRHNVPFIGFVNVLLQSFIGVPELYVRDGEISIIYA
jgi:hypothetical protein